ncbi:MAG: DMT family transporter [Rhodobacteraceae bacterium]|nr:DMT family transporter [Paracoccaceae bacterium]
MAAGMFLFSVVDTQAKFLTGSLHPIQIVWSRQMGMVLAVLVLLGLRGGGFLRSARPGWQVARGAVAAGSATLFIVAVSYVPLTDAVAVSFVAPFMVTLLGALVLRERVGMRRWGAVSIGFLATLIVIRPGTGAVHPAVLLVVLAAAFFAIRQVISRKLAGTDRTATTVAYTALVSVAILSLPLPFVWQWPSGGTEIALLCSMALIAAAAETCVIRALEMAQAVVVAPLHYTLLIWSTCWGYLVFADLPDFWTWAGALIIVATGVYTLYREHVVSRRGR